MTLFNGLLFGNLLIHDAKLPNHFFAWKDSRFVRI